MSKNNYITSNEVEDFLNSWKNGIIDIGIAYKEGSNYKQKARDFVYNHYAFDIGDVLFKPTYTHDVLFRNTLESALSYFIAGDISEDFGFAIKPWEGIKSSRVNILIEDNLCAVMGVLHLKHLDSKNETRIVFTFILIKSNDKIKIKIHHSSELN